LAILAISKYIEKIVLWKPIFMVRYFFQFSSSLSLSVETRASTFLK
jgi:hypothetical protein